MASGLPAAQRALVWTDGSLDFRPSGPWAKKNPRGQRVPAAGMKMENWVRA
jgi:hypothetical protein